MVAQAQFQPAFDQFIAGTQGNSTAIDKAADAFDALLKVEPGNAVLEVRCRQPAGFPGRCVAGRCPTRRQGKAAG